MQDDRYKQNEIETFFEDEVNHIQALCERLTVLTKRSRERPTRQGWRAMIAGVAELDCIKAKLEMLIHHVRCDIDGGNPYEGVDG
jgi:hypothetical protein